jgi:hypothetical protein
MIEMTFRVSEAESFRQWRDDEDAELDTLLARLRGQTEASDAMLAGTAFHKALELAAATEHTTLAALGYTFRFVDNFELAIPTIREVRAGKTYTGEDYAITISGQLDTIEGKRVEDHKTTGRFDPERYLGGYQWRLYLDIFGANQFRWNVFEIAATDDPMTWDVHAAHRLEQFRYPGMEADCARLAHDLAAFARLHMPERIRALPLAA